MPKQKDLKRRIRERMQKTGESYTTARARLLAKGSPKKAEKTSPPDYAKLAGMSDEAVEKKTGRRWAGWVDVLDRANAALLPHREIAKLLREKHGVGSWWAQSVTVAYERIRGLRDVGQRRGGGYDVNKSKTYPVPLDTLYAAFGARGRSRWLGEHGFTIKTSRRSKSMRVTWEDGSPLDLYFWEKGTSKSQVQLQHRERPSKADAEKLRAFWTEKLKALAGYLAED